MEIAPIDLVVLAAYFVAVMGIGAYFYRQGKSGTTDGFTKAGGSLPGWAVGLSILATYLSSISFLALPARSYAGNWGHFVFSLGIPVASVIAVRWFVPYYRKTGEASAYVHLERRFGLWARLYVGVCYLLLQLGRMGAVMYLMALPLHALLGWDMTTIILLTGISVIVYSMLGGLVAVIWTDALQAVVLMAGALLCALVMLFGMPAGPGEMLTLAVEHEKFSLGSFSPAIGHATFWVVLSYGIVGNVQNFAIDQNYVQRYVASRSDAEARSSVWLGTLLYVPVSALFFFIGTALFAFYTAQPELLPLDMQQADAADRIFPYFIVTQLPAGVTGLVIAAIFAAAMSTISTSLNSSATLLMTDWYRRLARPLAGEGESMIALRVATAVWGVLGTAAAVALIGSRAILDVWWTISGVFAGGMLGLFLLGFLSRRAGNLAAMAGAAAGTLVIGWMIFSPKLAALPEALRSPFHPFLIATAGTLTILLVGLLASQLLDPRRPERSAIDHSSP
jgi:solute:Na+ symporter, SSS family